MNWLFKIFNGALLLMIFFIAAAFPMGGKAEKVPMKPYAVINITDGEFLHYGYYMGGEKTEDHYMVATKVTNNSGEVLYRIYTATLKSTGKPFLRDYTNWPSYILIDPKRGSVMESQSSNIGADTDESGSSNPYLGLIYTHYQLFADKGYIEYISKSKKDKKIIESRYRVQVNPDFPSWDGPSFFYFPARFMDIGSAGFMYLISPEVMKDPFPFSLKYVSDETIRTKAGTFRVKKANAVTGDPFIARLAEPLLKNFAVWIEDSDRRLTIKVQIAYGGVLELEEISNVNIK